MVKTALVVLFVCLMTTNRAQSVHHFLLDDIHGETYSYDDLKGEKFTIIDFWASWCKPCMDALPKLDKLYRSYQAWGVEFISINTDGPRSISKVLPLVKALGVTYPVLSDFNNDVMQDLEVGALPTLLLVDSQNRIVYRHEGFSDGDELEIEQKLKQSLNDQ